MFFSAVIVTICGVVLLIFRAYALNKSHKSDIGSILNNLLSRMIHEYLCWRHPIHNQATGAEIPTCAYKWPNGQGDVGKFLEGMSNSDTWEKQHGRIYRLWSGTTPEIVLTTSSHIKAVFRDSDKHYKAVNNNSGWLMSQVLGQCLGLISGASWRALRKESGSAFLHSQANDALPLILDHVQVFVETEIRSKALLRGALDPVEDFKFLPFFIVAEILYGKLTDDMKRALLHMASLREELFKHIIQGGIPRFAVSKHLPIASNRLLSGFQRKWQEFNEKALQRAIENKWASLPVFQLFNTAKHEDFNRENVLQTMDEMLFANLDVTMGALSWNLVFLAHKEDTQKKLYAEIEEHTNDLLSYLRSSETHLASCILESARLKPLAAFSVPQSAPTDRHIDDYLVPAKTNFVIDAYSLNIRNSFWGQDSMIYRPERWEEVSQTETRYNYWRFGFGPRQCLGKYIADLIIRALLVDMLRRWILRKDESSGPLEDIGHCRETWISHPVTKLNCISRD